MILDFALLALGLTMLAVGGELLVRGASGLARGFGVSPFAIGLTVVAFGTSTPELAVNLRAAWAGSSEISFGNIVGSNLANIGLIFGLTALLRPARRTPAIHTREIPMMLLGTGAAFVMALDQWLGRGDDVWSRGDGVVLLTFFAVFLYYSVGDLLSDARGTRSESAGEDDLPPESSGASDILRCAAGLALLILGAEATVEGAVSVARDLGVAEVLIGLTFVAVGTSLPELATCLVAVFRGESSIAVGNVVGSNIFNLLLVAGLTALVKPIAIPNGALADLSALSVLSIGLWLATTSKRPVTIRLLCSALLAGYVVHITARSVTSLW